MTNTTNTTNGLTDSLRRDDMRLAVKPLPARKARPQKRYVVLVNGSIRNDSRQSRRTYSLRRAQRLIRLVRHFGGDGYVSAVMR